MRPSVSIALVGDFDAGIAAHRAIPLALGAAATNLAAAVEGQWLTTDAVACTDLGRFAGVWLVPGSPYRSLEGALTVVRWARERGVPFLGTCGGFQHALLELVRDRIGFPAAAHAEMDPAATDPVIARLACPLVEKSGRIRFEPNSRLRAAYGVPETIEGYHCNYGPNPAWTGRLEQAGVRFTAFDDEGEVRGFELPEHPFFAGTLFQPERRALLGQPVPLARALVAAALPADSR